MLSLILEWGDAHFNKQALTHPQVFQTKQDLKHLQISPPFGDICAH